MRFLHMHFSNISLEWALLCGGLMRTVLIAATLLLGACDRSRDNVQAASTNAGAPAPQEPTKVAVGADDQERPASRPSAETQLTEREEYESSRFCRNFRAMYGRPCPANVTVNQNHVMIRLSCHHLGQRQVLYSCFAPMEFSSLGFVRLRERGRIVEYIDAREAVRRFGDYTSELGPIHRSDFEFDAATNGDAGMMLTADLVQAGEVVASDQGLTRIRLTSTDLH